ncbi:MAG: amino acid transporter [Rhodobacterales bacterium]|nr:MAG: amino acid transporter [Rhodobacterales bacterium]
MTSIFLTPEFLAVATITLLAVMSPGPDFAIVSRNALIGGRKAGLATALGVGIGLNVHVAAAILGVGALLAASTTAFAIAKLVGGAYLIYLGIKTIRSASSDMAAATGTAMTPLEGFRWGATTNATNPKTAVFVLSVFTTVVTPQTPLIAQLCYGVFIALAHVFWFAIVALFFADPRVRDRLLSVKRSVEQVFGALLVFFGGAILTTTATGSK